MKKIIVITGQTATGKTRLALQYANKYRGELINCDSRQIYKHLDIITGKDRPPRVKIHLYDIVDPKQYFSSYDYVKQALPLIKKLLKKNKIPVIIGGSYLYLKHLLYDIKTEEIPPNWALRNQLKNKTVKELQQILKKIDVQSINLLNNSELNNPQRLIRKIEISSAVQPRRLYGHEFNTFITMTIGNKLKIKNLDVKFIGLRFKDKKMLRKKITVRVEKRLKKGAVKEVKNLLEAGYKETDPGLKTIGYQQIIQCLKGKLTEEEAINQWATKEFQYAKRQYTFMKKDSNIIWKSV